MTSAAMTTLSGITGRSITVQEVMEMLFTIYGPPAPPYPRHDRNS
jgi:hypothetical protein